MAFQAPCEYTDITEVGGTAVPTAAMDSDPNSNPAVPTISKLMGFNGTMWDRVRSGLTAATATLTGLLNTLPFAKYNATIPTLTDGQAIVNQADINGNQRVTHQTLTFGEDPSYNVMRTNDVPNVDPTKSWDVDKSAALEASTVTKASAGTIRSITGRIDASAGTATYYLLVLNHASLPADGAVTLLTAPVKIAHVTGTDSQINLDFLMNGVYATTGITVCLSTTEFTKTIAGAYLSTTVRYK